MRKKHPIRTFFTLLLLAALVAGLAAMPLLTADRGEDENKASILSGVTERRTLTKTLSTGAPLTAVNAETVRIPSGVKVTEFLAANGDTVKTGDPLARVDDVSVMTAVKTVQDSLDTIAGQLQTARGKITPGVITVDDEGKLCVNGQQIEESKLSSYTQFLTLSQQHREYEELLLDLFLLHQNGVVTAPCDGTVADLDKNMIAKLSSGGGAQLLFLAANTPAGDDSEIYQGYVKLVVGVNEDGSWQVRTGTTPSIVTDFLDLSNVNLAVSENVDICMPETVFTYSGGEWILADPQPGDILLYAYASDNSYWVIRIASVPITDPEEPTEEPTEPKEEETDPTDPEQQPAEPGEEQGGSRPGGGSSINWGQISGMISGGSRGGGAGSAGSGTSLYSTDTTVLCTVTPMENMTLSLPIDEMDIAQLQSGMTAEITLEALPNQQFSGTITDISRFGTNSGGSSKFMVTVELPSAPGMLPGMNANVTVVLESRKDCLTVPVAALAERGSQTVIYTARNEKTQELAEPVVVELGLSDGEYAEILSGLKEGASFCYSYYDTFEISTAVETRGAFG